MRTLRLIDASKYRGFGCINDASHEQAVETAAAVPLYGGHRLRNDQRVSGEEIWDVTDEKGVRTGDQFVRGASGWPAGGFHVVAATCVVDAFGRVLLTRRGPTKDFPGMWEFPGGSALSGESSAQAASRELLEEIGLRVSVDAVRHVGRFEEGTGLFDLYVVDVPAPQAPRPDEVEVTAFEWVDLAEVDRRRRDRELADPWGARLQALWDRLTAAVGSAAAAGSR